MTDWVRLWHDMPTDPKWRVVARKSGQPLACVVALFTLMMTTASAASDRGDVSGLSVEDAAAALDMDEEAVAAILEAMEGRVVADGRLSGWERRQPKREGAASTERVREFRERKAAASKRDETQRNAPETETETETDCSEANASKQAERGSALDALSPVVGKDRASAIVEMRKRIRAPLTAYGAQQLAKQLAKSRDPPAAADLMVERSWRGFKPEWQDQNTDSPRPNGPHHGQRSHRPSKADQQLAVMGGFFCGSDEPGLPSEDPGGTIIDVEPAGRGQSPHRGLRPIDGGRDAPRDWGNRDAPARRLSG